METHSDPRKQKQWISYQLYTKNFCNNIMDTGWCPPVISWFINPMKTTVISVISTINHSLNQFHGPVVTSWQNAPQSHWFQLDAWRCVDWNPSDVRCVGGKWFKKPYMIYPLIGWLWNISHFLWMWLSMRDIFSIYSNFHWENDESWSFFAGTLFRRNHDKQVYSASWFQYFPVFSFLIHVRL